MGGTVNVAIRLPDGTTTCTGRWTNNTPFWFKDPAMWARDGEHARKYLAATRDADYLLDPYAPGRPEPVENNSYGLIVWDYVAGVVLDNNDYTNLITFDPIWTGGKNVREEFLACANAGVLRRVTYSAATGQPVGTTDRLSPEEALRMGEEEHESQRLSWRRESSEPVSEYVYFVLDTEHMGMEYINYGQKSDVEYDEEVEAYPLHPDYAAKLAEIGFPMTVEEGLNVSLRPMPEPRTLGRNEKLARELFQEWKANPPPDPTEHEDGRTYSGTRFEDMPQRYQDHFTKVADGMTDTTARNFRLASMLAGSTHKAVLTIGGTHENAD